MRPDVKKRIYADMDRFERHRSRQAEIEVIPAPPELQAVGIIGAITTSHMPKDAAEAERLIEQVATAAETMQASYEAPFHTKH